MIFYYPLSLFSVYQLTIHGDCWILLLLASLVLFLIISYFSYCSYIILKTNKEDPQLLTTKTIFKIVYSLFYSEFKNHKDVVNRIWFFLPNIISNLLRAIIVGAFQQSGLSQLIGLFLIDSTLFACMIHYKPYKINIVNYFQISLSVVRVSIVLLLLPFVKQITISPITRIVVSLLLTTLDGLVVTFLALVLLVNLFTKVWKMIKRIKRKFKKDKKIKVKVKNIEQDDYNLRPRQYKNDTKL